MGASVLIIGIWYKFLQAVVVGFARRMVEGVPEKMYDPNAIDTLHFSISLAFVWPAIAKPRQRRLPVR
jgi:hypothetical protein